MLKATDGEQLQNAAQLMAVTMNIGPFVLANAGPPSGIWSVGLGLGPDQQIGRHACYGLIALRCAVVRRNR
jgi:hypothetical protein